VICDLAGIGEHLNVLITDPTGVGKSFVASALAHSAGRADYAVRFFRLPRLIDELARRACPAQPLQLFRQLAKVDLLLDDFALVPLTEQTKARLARDSQ
jgi:DNA replication protein DnaC